MNNTIKQYLPSLGMVFAAVLQALYTSLQDNRLSITEVLVLFYALTGAVTLYIVPRAQNAQWLKPVVAAATAALVAGQSALGDGVMSAQDWVTIAIQVLVGLGIVVATNKQVPVTPADSVIRRAG